MNSIERIERYVSLFRLRLKMLASSRGTAAMSAAALAITVVAVTVADLSYRLAQAAPDRVGNIELDGIVFAIDRAFDRGSQGSLHVR